MLRRIDVDRTREVYRAVTWAPASEGRELIGYYDSLELASQGVWVHWATTRATSAELAVGSAQRVDVPPMPAPTSVSIRPVNGRRR